MELKTLINKLKKNKPNSGFFRTPPDTRETINIDGQEYKIPFTRMPTKKLDKYLSDKEIEMLKIFNNLRKKQSKERDPSGRLRLLKRRGVIKK